MPEVRIYRPSKTAMQSGKRGTHRWVLEYAPASPRAPDPLMGWASAADTLNEVRLKFPTLEDAVAFAKNHGLEYVVSEPKEQRFKPKSYAENFRFDRPELKPG